MISRSFSAWNAYIEKQAAAIDSLLPFLISAYCVISSLSLEKYSNEEIKNSSDYLLVFLVLCCSFFAAMYGYLSYQELQEYLDYNKEINSYQRRLKDNHK